MPTLRATPTLPPLPSLPSAPAPTASGLTLCLGPGGLPGVDILAGAWLALQEAGVRPSRVTGCSAGALVAAILAAGRLDANGFASILGRLNEATVIRKRLCWKERVFWLDHFVQPGPIAALLERYLPDDFADLQIPLSIAATCMGTAGQPPVGRPNEWPEVFAQGPNLRRKVLASMSMPGVFPYVELAGRQYSDGATTEPFVLPTTLGASERVIVCQPVRRLSFVHRDRNVFSRLLWGAEMLAQRTALAWRERLTAELGDRLLWLELDLGPGSALRFQHDLILEGYCQVRRELRHWWPRQHPAPTRINQGERHHVG